jgi:hypothetical protein
MVKKNRLAKGLNSGTDDYQDFVELFEEDVMDEEIARDMNIDIETVRSIKKELQDEEVADGPSLFFKTSKSKKNRRQI